MHRMTRAGTADFHSSTWESTWEVFFLRSPVAISGNASDGTGDLVLRLWEWRLPSFSSFADKSIWVTPEFERYLPRRGKRPLANLSWAAWCPQRSSARFCFSCGEGASKSPPKEFRLRLDYCSRFCRWPCFSGSSSQRNGP